MIHNSAVPKPIYYPPTDSSTNKDEKILVHIATIEKQMETMMQDMGTILLKLRKLEDLCIEVNK